MQKIIELKIFPKHIDDEAYINQLAAQVSKIPIDKITGIQYLRKSIDARGKKPFYRLRCAVFYGEHPPKGYDVMSEFRSVENSPAVHIIGAGPAGYFAALQLIRMGLKPIIFERGKDVRQRRRDLRAIQQFGEVNAHSNYCFGEGGAGTYSDGKLYTRSHKRGKIEDILQLLVAHGAKEDILFDAHPHIGSNKLPAIVTEIRNTIERYGGEVHFNHHVEDIQFEGNRVKSVVVNNDEIPVQHLILATGHSARDIYEVLHQHQVHMEPKPFALGVRIEHPQSLIDQIQYNQSPREENLPASSYRVVTQVDDHGVFSFCMCPGGLIVPAATAPGELVVNGMSLSRRDSPFANSGFVTAVEMEDLNAHGYHGLFASLDLQKDVEQKLFNYGDGSQKAPAQRVEDFVNGITSDSLNPTSYIPGIYSAPLHELLPDWIYQRLRQGILNINRKMKGYLTNEANIIGVESRTSSPITIPRDRTTYLHPDFQNFYPCGEGAGYAGGILSACMDGINVAKAVHHSMPTKHKIFPQGIP